MKIAIIAAMQKEIELLLPLVDDKKECEYDGFTVIEGRIGIHSVSIMQCGIGKVNSALSTNALIEGVRPDMVINTGVAGGSDLSMHICDVLVADAVSYHDVWCGPGTEYGAAYGFPIVLRPDETTLAVAREQLKDDNIHFGMICSGDKFITSEQEIAEIKTHFPQALAVDMESASIAQVCTRHTVPFMIIRAISDTPGSGENISQYEDFWSKAPENTFSALVRLLGKL